MRTRIQIIAALWLFMFVNYLDRVALSFAGPAIMSSLSLDAAEFGIILSSFGLGYLLSQIPGGLLADRWGARLLLVVGPILWAVFTGVTGFVATVVGFVIVRFCFGLSEGISAMSNYRVVGDHFDSRQRAQAMAICWSAAPLAPALGGLIVGKILDHYSWQAVFFLLTLPALLVAGVNYKLIPATKPPLANQKFEASDSVASDDVHPFGQLLKSRSLWLLCLASSGYNIGFWGFQGWMPTYLNMERQINLESVGELSSIPYVFGLIGLLVIGALSGRLTRFRLQSLAGCYAAAGLSLFLAYQAEGIVLALVGLSAGAFFMYGSLGPLAGLILDLAPSSRQAAYAGIVNTLSQSSSFIAPAVIGFLVNETGTFASGFGFMIVALGVAAGSVLLLGPRKCSRSETEGASLPTSLK